MTTQQDRKVRYAVVGAGWIAQEVFMPGVAHTGNSTIQAIVTGRPEKGKKLAQDYGIQAVYPYERYTDLLRSGDIDAVYIATPNDLHADYAVPALQAGIHVLLEKPLEITVERCLMIAEAARTSNAKLMVAYRLHFEPATLAAIARVRNGDLGELRMFSSVFAQPLSAENHRAKNGFNSGPVLDMGPYPINAVRNLFQAEPEEVFAMGARHPEAELGDFDDTVTTLLRFPGGRLAQFSVSYDGNPINQYTLLGTKGSLVVSPAYTFGQGLRATLTTGEEVKEERFADTDQFGGELRYFSDCILEERDPEPDVTEGIADVRIAEAIHRSLETGIARKLPPFHKHSRIDLNQLEQLPKVQAPALVEAYSPIRG